ncbi:hypothetical protein BKA62DRAFT_768547 [Auriculariales sp. MPI-PUGE-AT-0066]|nr:hypothetical protein BKA62DRAFT_768547 [Auriculariales sp. MPI-PUGE-AT-0066]
MHLLPKPNPVRILLDAALERCGNAPSEIDATAVTSSATCCDIELAKLAQACWTCTKPEASAADCDAATVAADIAIGMSTCMSRLPALTSSHVEHQQPPQMHVFSTRDNHMSFVNTSNLFMIAFFTAMGVIGIAVMTFILHRCRRAQPYRKRAHRRAMLDLMEGFSPAEERRRTDTPEPAAANPWVRFQPDHDAVSLPPQARSRTHSPTTDEMFEVARPVAHGLEIPKLVVSTTTPRFENGAMVMASPMMEPVAVRRY